MKVRLIQKWRTWEKGHVHECATDDEGRWLIRREIAEPIDAPPRRETASVAPAAERADKPGGQPRRRRRQRRPSVNLEGAGVTG